MTMISSEDRMIDTILTQTRETQQRMAQAGNELMEMDQRISEQTLVLQRASATLQAEVDTLERDRVAIVSGNQSEVAEWGRMINDVRTMLNTVVSQTQELESQRAPLQQQAVALQQRVDFLKTPAGVLERARMWGATYQAIYGPAIRAEQERQARENEEVNKRNMQNFANEHPGWGDWGR